MLFKSLERLEEVILCNLKTNLEGQEKEEVKVKVGNMRADNIQLLLIALWDSVNETYM